MAGIKGKSGRKKDAVSFVYVSLAELNGVLKPDAQVMVARKYSEMLKLNGSPVAATPKKIEALASPSPIEEIDLGE